MGQTINSNTSIWCDKPDVVSLDGKGYIVIAEVKCYKIAVTANPPQFYVLEYILPPKGMVNIVDNHKIMGITTNFAAACEMARRENFETEE